MFVCLCVCVCVCIRVDRQTYIYAHTLTQTVAMRAIKGQLVKGRGLSALVPPQPAKSGDSAFFSQGHLFRRVELAGSSTARKRGKEALLDLCLSLTRPPDVAPDVWMEMLHWRQWYVLARSPRCECVCVCVCEHLYSC